MATIAKFDAQGNVLTQGVVSKEMFPFVAKAKAMKSQGKTLVEFEATLSTPQLKNEWSDLCNQFLAETNASADDSNYDQVLEDCAEENATQQNTSATAPVTKGVIMAEKKGRPIQLVKVGTKVNLSTPKSKYKRGKNEFIFVGKIQEVNIQTVTRKGGDVEFVNTGRDFNGQYASLGKRNYTVAFEILAPFGEIYNAFNTKGNVGTKTVEFRIDQLLGSTRNKNRGLIEVLYKTIVSKTEDISQKATLDLYRDVLDALEERGVHATAISVTTELYVQMQCEERIEGVTMYPELYSNVEKLVAAESELITEMRPNVTTGASEKTVLAYHNVDSYAGVTINQIDKAQWDIEVAKQKETSKAKNIINLMAEGKEAGVLNDDMITRIISSQL